MSTRVSIIYIPYGILGYEYTLFSLKVKVLFFRNIKKTNIFATKIKKKNKPSLLILCIWC